MCLLFDGGQAIGSCRKRLHFQQTKFKKRPSSWPSLGRDSCSNASHGEVHANPGNASNKCGSSYVVEKPGKNGCKSNNLIRYRTRLFYNSSVKPKVIEASLARKSKDSIVKNAVKTCKTQSYSDNVRDEQTLGVEQPDVEVKQCIVSGPGLNPNMVQDSGKKAKLYAGTYSCDVTAEC